MSHLIKGNLKKLVGKWATRRKGGQALGTGDLGSPQKAGVKGVYRSFCRLCEILRFGDLDEMMGSLMGSLQRLRDRGPDCREAGQ